MRASGKAQALPTPWEVGVIGAACGLLLQITPQGKAFCWVGKDSGKTRSPFDDYSVAIASVH